MKIYVLLNENEKRKNVCVSEDINKIRTSMCEDFKPGKDYPGLEIWEKGECIYSCRGTDVLRKIASETNAHKT